MSSIIEAYENFDLRKESWVKVMVQPARNEKQKIAASEVRMRSKKRRRK